MGRKIILHGGLPKTGTTTVQNAFWQAREMLLAEGRLMYPSVDANHTNAICTIFLDDPSKHITNQIAAIGGNVDLAALQDEYRAKIEADLNRDGWDVALISAEGIANLSAAEITKFRDWALGFADEIEALYWVREPVAFATSNAQQLVKGGWSAEKLNEQLPVPNFQGRIGNAISVFGRDSVRIEPFEAAIKHEGGVVGAFADHVGLDPTLAARIADSESHDNVALSDEAVKMLMHLNKVRPLFASEEEQRRTGHETMQMQRVVGTKFKFSLAMRRRIYNFTRPDVAWLNKTFDRSLYQKPFDDRDDQDKALRPDTLASIAMLISDILNENEALRLTLKTQHSLEDGDPARAQSNAARATRLSGEKSFVREALKRIPIS
ncbi:MAG: hypothetical protein AAGF60_06470 [Pseudomonadota bacterium]